MPRKAAAFFWVIEHIFGRGQRRLPRFQALLFQKYELSTDVQAMANNILSQYGPQAALVIIHGISGETARSELETFADPLKRMVFAQPRAKQWVSDALFTSTFPSSKVGDAEKRVFLQQIMRSVNVLLDSS